MTGRAAARDTVTTAAPGFVSRLLQRDHRALAEFYDLHAGRAYALAYRALGDVQLAEDVVHDAFIWLWEHPERIDTRKGPPEALLLTIVRRRAIDAQRRTARRSKREERVAQLDRIDDEALAVIAAIDQEELLHSVREGLASLQKEQRDVLELAYFRGMTHAAIAEQEHLALGTVKSRLRLGLAHLRSTLGGSHADM